MVGARTIAVSAALVASSTVSGFMIPPTSLSATEQGGDSFTMTIGSDHPPQVEQEDLTRRIVRVPCFECAPEKDGDAQLLFDFALSEDRKTLYFNDEVLYPDAESHKLSAAVVSVDESIADFQATEKDHSSIPIELRGPGMVRSMDVQGAVGMKLVQMSYSIVALRHGRNIHDSRVKAMLFRDAQGALTIIRVSAFNVNEDGEAIPVPGPADLTDKPIVSPHQWVKPGCEDIMCGAEDKLHAKFEELKLAMAKSKETLKHAIDEVKVGHPPVLEAIEKSKEPMLETIEHGKHHLFKKPCPKHGDGFQISDEGVFPTNFGHGLQGGDESNIAPPPTEQLAGDEPAMVHRPGHGHGHGHHHPHHDKQHFFDHSRMHRFRAHAAAVVLHIFVPIVFGVLIGLATYAIGVFVGCGIVWLWVRLVRRGKKNAQYEELPTYDSDEEERYLDSPKASNEAPPAYAERWSQEEAVEKEVQTDEERRE